MPKLDMDLSGLNEVLEQLNKMGEDAQKAAEEATREAFKIITRRAENAIQKPNLPAQGRYSHGRSEKSLVKEPKFKWSGTAVSVDVGFNIKHGGLPTIFMMYGTPRYMKVQALYDAFYGEQTQTEIYRAVEKILTDKLQGGLG